MLLLYLKKGGESMEEIYTSYTCKGCNKTTIVLTSECNNTQRQGRYIACSHCGSKRIKVLSKTNNLRECMGHSSYKRKGRALRQVVQNE